MKQPLGCPCVKIRSYIVRTNFMRIHNKKKHFAFLPLLDAKLFEDILDQSFLG